MTLYKDLYIYEISGEALDSRHFFPQDFLGCWNEDEVSFLFFSAPHDHEILPRGQTGAGFSATAQAWYEHIVRERQRSREEKEIRCSKVVSCSDDRAGSIVRRLIRPCHELPHEWFITMGPVRPLRLAGN